MATTVRPEEQLATTPELRMKFTSTRLVLAIAVFSMVVGAFSALGGLGGAIYTYQQAAVQDITTPDDAVFAEVPVRGPLSMWAQADIITHTPSTAPRACTTRRWSAWSPRSTRPASPSSVRTASPS